MKIIGLCGGSGSGKGFVSKIFLTYGIPSIDTDKVYHELISTESECLYDLVGEFGKEILNKDGTLDRAALREIVFKDGADGKRAALNRISHFHVLNRTREIISELKKKNYPAVLIDAPLLFESGFDKECDLIISVTADKDIRIKRITERDCISYEDAEKRISTQLPDEYLISKSQYNIHNNATEKELSAQIKEIIKTII